VAIEIGRRFDNQALTLPWPNCPHLGVGGQTGSGKSGLVHAVIGALADDPTVAVVGIDLKLVELSPWSERLTDLATTPTEADRLLVALRNLIRARAELLRSSGFRKWDSKFGPWVLVVIDELAELQAVDADRLADVIESGEGGPSAMRDAKNGQQVRTALLGSLSRLARFCGVTVLAATQYPSAEVIDQQIRTQLTIKIMLRVASGEQVAVCLGQGYAATVSPKSIGPSEQGGLWIVGTEDAPRPVRGRAHWVSDTAIANRVAATTHLTPSYNAVFGKDDTDDVFEAY